MVEVVDLVCKIGLMESVVIWCDCEGSVYVTVGRYVVAGKDCDVVLDGDE